MNPSREFDLGIRAKAVFSPSSKKETQNLSDVFVGIRGPMVAEIGPFENQKAYCKRWIERPDSVLMPGLHNAHTHLAMSLFKGVADDVPFGEWLFQYILPLEAKLVDSGFVRLGTELAALELIHAGVTSVVDMYYFSETVAEVLERAGLKAWVSQALADFKTPDSDPGAVGSKKILDRLVERYSRHERIRPAIGTHAPYTCSNELLRWARKRAEQSGLLLNIHLSETRQEVEDSLREHGKTPFERLRELGFLGSDVICAHGVHLDEKEIELFARCGATLAHNPESNLKLGSGIAPVHKYFRAGARIRVGTDGSGSNNDLSVFRELATASLLQKHLTAGDSPISSSEWFRMACDQREIKVGADADLILIRVRGPELAPAIHLPGTLLYSASGQEVVATICHGQVLMENGKVEVLDEARILDEVERFKPVMAQAIQALPKPP